MRSHLPRPVASRRTIRRSVPFSDFRFASFEFVSPLGTNIVQMTRSQDIKEPAGYVIVKRTQNGTAAIRYMTDEGTLPLSAQLQATCEDRFGSDVVVNSASLESVLNIIVDVQHNGRPLSFSLADNAVIIDDLAQSLKISVPYHREEISEVKLEPTILKNFTTYEVSSISEPPRYAQFEFLHKDKERTIGCSPVAAALLLTALKKSKFDIFDKAYRRKGMVSHTCFLFDWPTNQPHCVVVADFMKSCHFKFKTSSDGTTRRRNITRGLADALKAQFGIKTSFYDQAFKVREKAHYEIKQGKAVMINADADWDRLAGFEAEKRKEGHSVLSYKSRNDGKDLLVSFGWGQWVSDAWISFAELKNPSVVYWKHRLDSPRPVQPGPVL